MRDWKSGVSAEASHQARHPGPSRVKAVHGLQQPVKDHSDLQQVDGGQLILIRREGQGGGGRRGAGRPASQSANSSV